MPTLAAPLDCAKLETRNERIHQLSTAPSSPVTGQVYYNTTDNTFYWWDGTIWQSAKGGAPGGAAGGDLGGTYPNPTVNPHHTRHEPGGSDAMAVDAAVGVGSLRTLGAGAQQAMPGNRTLDAVPVAAADVNLNSKKITALATPISGTDAANKAYVDAAAQNLDVKASCRAASANLTNINLAAPGASIDGVTLAAGDRVLVSQQSSNVQNGIYVWNGAAVPMTRALDADSNAEVTAGMFTFITEGATNADTGWILTTNDPINLGTDGLVFTQFSGAGSVVAGAGLTKTGAQLDVGQGAGIQVNADTVQVAPAGITTAMIAPGAINVANAAGLVVGQLPVANGGTGAAAATGARLNLGVPTWYTALNPAGATWTILQSVHNIFASRAIMVQVLNETTGVVLLADITIASTGDVTITFAASQSASTIRAILCGLQSGGSPTQPA